MRARDVSLTPPKGPALRLLRVPRTDEALDEASRKAGEIRLPRVGTIFVKGTTTSPDSVDLQGGGTPPNVSSGFETALPPTGTQSLPVSTSGGGTPQTITPINPGGFIGRWIDIYADAQDIGIISGPTQGSVTSGNAPVLATNGGVGTAGTCMRIAAGSYRSYYVTPDDRWLGFVAAGAGQIRIAESSR